MQLGDVVDVSHVLWTVRFQCVCVCMRFLCRIACASAEWNVKSVLAACVCGSVCGFSNDDCGAFVLRCWCFGAEAVCHGVGVETLAWTGMVTVIVWWCCVKYRIYESENLCT